MKIRKAVIPAAGLGTRFLPATKAQPKEMLPIVDKPAIQYIVEEAVASGIEDILIITGRNKRAIEDHFDRSLELELLLTKSEKEETLQEIRSISNLGNIYYIRQQEALGLGHAVLCARHFIGQEPFAVLLGDDIVSGQTPALKQMIDACRETDAAILGVQPVPYDHTHKYGIIEKGQPTGQALVHNVRGVHEKPAHNPPSNLAIIGRYLLPATIFDLLENCRPGYGGEIQLSDALHELCLTNPVYAKEIQGRRYDIGDKLGYLTANIELALEREEMREAVQAYLKQQAATQTTS